MKKNKLIALIMFVIAGFLIYLGLNQANSPFGEISEAFTGSYQDETLAYLFGGGISGVIGFYYLFKK